MKRVLMVGALVLGGYVSGACSSAGGGAGGGGDVCGDGVRTGTEICEGTDLGGTTCKTLGFTGGTPTCTDQCAFDTSTCCQDSCANLGDMSCSGDKVQTCVEKDGCRVYSTTIDCAASGQQCVAANGTAQCNAGCTNACTTLNATQCNAGAIETCLKGTDGCLSWTPGVDCTQAGQACQVTGGTAQCGGTCNNPCTAEGTQCTGTQLQTCAQGNDGCFTLTTTEDCATSGKTCKVVNGTAQCGTTCTNKCATAGIEACAGNVRQTCTLDSSSGCLDWVVTEDCTTKQQYCKLAGASKTKCEGVCTNPCTTLNEKKCNANAIEECKLGVNGCQEWQATTTCPIGQACSASGGTYSCVAAAATGEDCGTVIPVKAGTNTINWTATKNDYLTTPPSCGLSYSISGGDVVLVYQSTFTGNVEFSLAKTAGNRVDVVVAGGSCGSLASQLACVSDSTGTLMSGNFNVSSGSNYFFYVADTTSGTAPLDNPLQLTLTEIDCTTFASKAVSLSPANGSTTSTLTPKLVVDFDVPSVISNTNGTVTITGNKGTNITYTLSPKPTELTWSNNNKTLTIAPGIAFPAGEVVTVSLDGFVDSKCNKLVTKPAWSFTVITPPCSPGTNGMVGSTKTSLGSSGSSYMYYIAADQAANGYIYFGNSSGMWRLEKATAIKTQVTVDTTVLGYDMLMDGATPFSIENTTPTANSSGHLYKLVAPTWGSQSYLAMGSTAATGYFHSGATYKGKMYLVSGSSSTSTATQIWSVPAGLSTPNNAVTLEASITGEGYCNGLAVDDKYFYVTCATGERLIKIDRSTQAVTLVTDAFDLYASTTYSNGIQAHDTNNDGTADFLYYRGALADVYFVCNPSGGQTYADKLVSFGTTSSSYNGLAFDAANKKIWVIENTTGYPLYEIK